MQHLFTPCSRNNLLVHTIFSPNTSPGPLCQWMLGLWADHTYTHRAAHTRAHTHKTQDYRFLERCGRAALTGLAPWVRHTIGSGYAAPKLSLGTISNPRRFMILIWAASPLRPRLLHLHHVPFRFFFCPTFVVLFLAPRGNAVINKRQPSLLLLLIFLFFSFFEKRKQPWRRNEGRKIMTRVKSSYLCCRGRGKSTVMQRDGGRRKKILGWYDCIRAPRRKYPLPCAAISLS